MSIIQDPTFLPITIIFLVLLLIALWQKLDRYIIPLFIVYVLYAVYTAFTIEETRLPKTMPLPDENEWPVVNRIDEKVKPVEIKIDTSNIQLQRDTKKGVEPLSQTIPDLHVNTLLFCENIIDSVRRPVNIGNEFPINLEKVYCYSGIRNISGTRTILYEWYFE